MAELKIKNLNIKNCLNGFTLKRSITCGLVIKKPFLYKLINWIFSKKPIIKKMILCDFINDTNGRQIVKLDMWNGEGEEVSIEAEGLILKNLELKHK